MKNLFIALIFLLLMPLFALAEEGGEAGEHKPPPKPLTGTPVEVVIKLPIVEQWSKWVASFKGAPLNVWGESLNEAGEKKCWAVAVGKLAPGGKQYVMRRFCVPEDGSEVLVESNPVDPNAEVIYTPYSKWVEQCKPTDQSEGNC